jgi:site-specific recombinase XerD
MENRAFASPKTAGCSLDVDDLQQGIESWLLDGQIRQLSRHTLVCRRFLTDKLLWFLREEDIPVCDKRALQRFFAYVITAHESPQGRWGNPREREPVRPRTAANYFRWLRTLFRFLVAEGMLEQSPMEGMRPAAHQNDQVQPFAPEQVAALIAAAKRSRHPRRNEAVLLFLLDTGVRADELCRLKMSEVDLAGKRALVLGKGGKKRTVYIGGATTRAVLQYLREQGREPRQPLFLADGGRREGEALTPSGLLKLITRLGQAARIEATRCSPHTFRHTFAIEFLRAGGNMFTLKELLGHTTLTMVNRYVALAQADIENQHRQFSPVDRMKKR